MISVAHTALNVIRHKGHLLPDKEEHFTSYPKTHLKIIFSHIPSQFPPLLELLYSQMICADSAQVCGQQQTRGYDLECHKELFYIKERGGVCDYGYTEPYSQGDPQSLV